MTRPADVYVYVFVAALLGTVAVLVLWLTLARPVAPPPAAPGKTLQQVLVEEQLKRGITPREVPVPDVDGHGNESP